MTFTLPSGTPAELVTPADGRQPSQGLVLVPDIGSLRPLFVEHAQRLADEQGWVVCTFEIWGKEGGPETLEEKLARAGSLRDEEVLGDAVAAADSCGVDPVAVTGFCIGGMYAFKASALGRFARSVGFYGMIRLPEDWRSPTQAEPLVALRSPDRCPTMAIIGTADPFTPADDVADLEAAGVEVVRYEGAEHGFIHVPDRPAHRAAYAADAWPRVTGFLTAD
jgi:dienelactone hydrolase